jgi:hypothetical protein
LTGDFGRPQMFWPMRRSSLYLAAWRFDMSRVLLDASFEDRALLLRTPDLDPERATEPG